MKLLLFLSLITLTWTGAFLIFDKFPLYMLFFTLLGIGAHFLKVHKKLYTSDSFLFIFLVYITLNGLLQNNSKTFNYLLTYYFVFIFLYLLIRQSFRYFTYENLSKYIIYSVILSIFIILSDAFTRNFTSYSINVFINRSKEATGTFNASYIRAYALATEPGVLAYYLSTIGLLPFFLIDKRKNVIIYGLIFLLAEVSIYSAAGLVALFIGFIIYLFFNKNFLTLIKQNKFSLFCFLLLIFYVSQKGFFDTFFNKVLFSESSSSSSHRLLVWSDAFNRISNQPFLGPGIGFLSSKGLGSPISWFLFVAVETGLIGLMLLFMWLIMAGTRIIKKSIKSKKSFYIIGFVAGLVHLSVISGFQYPFLFIYMAFFEAKIITQEN